MSTIRLHTTSAASTATQDQLHGGRGRDTYKIKPGSDVTLIEEGDPLAPSIDTIDFSEAGLGITFDVNMTGQFQTVDSDGNRIALFGSFEVVVGISFGDKLTATSLPILDAMLSSLLQDLHDRGLLETTIVTVLGEMGRNKIYKDPAYSGPPGRDHWGTTQFVLVAGGGFRQGMVLGATDRTSLRVVDKYYSPS